MYCILRVLERRYNCDLDLSCCCEWRTETCHVVRLQPHHVFEATPNDWIFYQVAPHRYCSSLQFVTIPNSHSTVLPPHRCILPMQARAIGWRSADRFDTWQPVMQKCKNYLHLACHLSSPFTRPNKPVATACRPFTSFSFCSCLTTSFFYRLRHSWFASRNVKLKNCPVNVVHGE